VLLIVLDVVVELLIELLTLLEEVDTLLLDDVELDETKELEEVPSLVLVESTCEELVELELPHAVKENNMNKLIIFFIFIKNPPFIFINIFTYNITIFLIKKHFFINNFIYKYTYLNYLSIIL